jgi:HSP20 family protein
MHQKRNRGLLRTAPSRSPENGDVQYRSVAHIYFEQGDPDFTDRRQADGRFQDLLDDPAAAGAGECSPPMDVLETTAGIEIVVDLPGVRAESLRILFSQGTVIVAGRKLTGGCAHQEAAFHLAERSFGRFVRAVRLAGAYDAGHATATLAAGELRIALPRIEERRGRDIHIRITER